MREVKIPESDKYLANAFFISGFAFWSLIGGMSLELLKTGDVKLLSLNNIVVLIALALIGLAFLGLGWFTLGKWDLD